MSESDTLESYVFEGILFDLDGTLVNSANAVQRYWHRVADDLGVEPQTIIQNARGRRSIDTIGLHDPSKATWEYVTAIESAIPKDFGSDAREVRGSTSLLQQLTSASVPWAIVTSCTRSLLFAWVEALALPAPAHTVAAEDVKAGKPDPACYVLARERIGKDAQRPLLVVEDSPTGVRAGKASGCRVLGVTTNVEADVLREAGADFVVSDFTALKVERFETQDSDHASWKLVI